MERYLKKEMWNGLIGERRYSRFFRKSSPIRNYLTPSDSIPVSGKHCFYIIPIWK
jgi:hypothetical protein